METWYGVWKASGRVNPVKVVKRTNKTLTLASGTKVAIASAYAIYFDNMTETVQYARQALERGRDRHLELASEFGDRLAELRKQYPAEFEDEGGLAAEFVPAGG